jgi:uncharacterized damage-inducible protein DinB
VGIGGERTLAELYRGWDVYQQRLVKAIAPLDGTQLDLGAAPHLWPIRMLGNHVVSARAWWFHSWMGEGGAQFDEILGWDEDEASTTRSAAEIVRGLELTWSLIESALERWSIADLEKEFERPIPNAAGERPRRSRQWIIWHVAEHDMHHGGEISFSLGMHHLAGIEL